MSETPKFGSLLEEAGIPVTEKTVPRKPRWDRRLDAALRRRAAVLWNDQRKRNIAISALTVLAFGAMVGLYFATRPVPKPDFTTANIDVLFNYTLLTEEFNSLPIEERIELLAQLVERLKNIDGEQSLLMAMFAAQIQGEVRKQFERNASLLAVDLFDSYAQRYDPNAPPEDRAAFVESKFIEFEKTLERIAGEERDKSDEERLIDARRQAKRDLEFVQSGRMPIESTVRMLTFVDQGVGREATGHQKIRINSFLSQMVRTLREGEVPPEPEPPAAEPADAPAAEQPAQPPPDAPIDDLRENIPLETADRTDSDEPEEGDDEEDDDEEDDD